MLFSLTFNSNAIVRKEEIKFHQPFVLQPRKGLLLTKENLMDLQQQFNLILQVALVTGWTALAKQMAGWCLPKLPMFFADDTNGSCFINIPNL